MSVAIWIPLVFAMVLPLAPITNGGTSKLNEKQLGKYARKMGLPLPAELRPAAVQRITRTERAAVLCGLLGAGVGALVALLLRWWWQPSASSAAGALMTVGLLLAASLGGFVATIRGRDPLVPDAPRVARASATTLADYETRGAARAFALVPVAMAIGLAAAWGLWAVVAAHGGEDRRSVMLIATGCTALLAVCWAVLIPARRALIERPQRAHTDLELAWDDATRSSALAGLTGTGVAAGLLATFVSLVSGATLLLDPALRAQWPELTLWLGLAAVATGLVCWAILLIPTFVGSTANPSLALWRGRDLGGEEAGRC